MPVYERFTYCLIPAFCIVLFMVQEFAGDGFWKTAVNRFSLPLFYLLGLFINGYLLYCNVDIAVLSDAIVQGLLLVNLP